MIATMIRPGLYRVRGAGLDQLVIASHGCDAIAALICEVLP
jgi:hypothetical protein